MVKCISYHFSRFADFFVYTYPSFISHPLWRGRRLKPFLRYFRLQVLFCLGYKQVSVPWIGNLTLPLRKGDTGLTGNYYLGLHEFTDMSFTFHLLRENDLFLDIGANLGSYSLLAAALSKAECLSFEPVPSTFQRLNEIIRLNLLSARISTKCIALSCPSEDSRNKLMRFSDDRGCMNSFVDDSYPGRSLPVEVSTLDDQCAGLNPVLLKIDVEGHESDLLRGALRTLRNPSLLAIIIEDQTPSVNDLLKNSGFKDYTYLPLSRTLTPSPVKLQNRIWVKSSSFDLVSQLVRSSPCVNVHGMDI